MINMKLQKLLYWVALIAITVSAAGCRKGLEKTTLLPGYGAGAPGGKDSSTPLDPNAIAIKEGGIPVSERIGPDWKPSAEQPFTRETVYFEFDKSSIKQGETSKLDRIASEMKQKYRGKGLRVEGHCDERGTEEYNRSLGDKRAHSIREYLARAGVDPQMIDVVSFGEDRPAVSGHSEAAYAKNRRGEFVLLDPPR